jgi:prepilin peptidase CpaA
MRSQTLMELAFAAALNPTVLAVAAVLLIGAALHDIAARTIPNWLPATLAVDGVVGKLLAGQVLIGLAVGAAVFGLAALLWHRGLMGGGDVKLLGAAAIVVSPALAPSFLVMVSLAGGVLALLYLLLRRVVPPPGAVRPVRRLARIMRAERRRIRECRSLPYACAIATGALFVMIGG